MAEQGKDIPRPPHPQKRREPLPGQIPKFTEEDPEARRRLEVILQSPSYREADEDVDFLRCGETRGPRLQLDYLKAEQLLEQHGVRHTVVVFGGTRIREPTAALKQARSLGEAAAANPGDAALARRLKVAERLLEKSRYYDVAREFGRLVGQSNKNFPESRWFVMTGGGPGIMEAANRGAQDAGVETIGLNIRLPNEQFPNSYVTPDLCFRFHYFAIRKLHFMLRARAFIAFPGGYGTFDELFQTLTLAQTRTMKPVPVVLVGESYWRRAINFEFLAEEGLIDPEDKELFWFAETAQDIWSGIRRWHAMNDEMRP